MDLLPKVETQFIEEDPAPLKEEDESDSDDIKVEEVSVVPEVEKKPVIPEEDIFVEKKVDKPKLSVEPIKKPARKKREMTPEQLERLRIGREKGLAKRRALAAEKKELKELNNKKKKQELDKLRQEVNETPKPKSAPVPAPAPAPSKVLTLDDLPAEMLMQLQQAAIEGYDTKRKARKAKKKAEESKQSEVNHFKNMVSNAVNPKQPARYGEPGFFSHLF